MVRANNTSNWEIIRNQIMSHRLRQSGHVQLPKNEQACGVSAGTAVIVAAFRCDGSNDDSVEALASLDSCSAGGLITAVLVDRGTRKAAVGFEVL